MGGWVRTRAMELHGRQTQLLRDILVLDLSSFLERQTQYTFSHVGRRGDGASAAESLEFDVGDDTVVADADLELHDIAAAIQQKQSQR